MMSTAIPPSPTSKPAPTPKKPSHAEGHQRCLTCLDAPGASKDGHRRKWTPDPNCPERKGRTLVVCFDGTGDSFDKDNSNIVQFLSMLMKDDPMKQLVYYQAGIGTYAKKPTLAETVIKYADMMLAFSVDNHVKEGYLFLMQNYHFGDQICIFGFSRGAYTARALAGMVQKIGLLPWSNLEQFPFAYEVYKRRDDDGIKESENFKRTFSIDVRIKFLGVWDTVESVGLFPLDLPFSDSNNSIAFFRHALALDERRVKFIPSFYIEHDCKPKSADADAEKTNCEEVFFAGAHGDVGGGYVDNETRNSLARISLRWMVRECFKAETGIIFDAHMLEHEIGLDISVNPVSEAPTLPSPHPSSILSSEMPRSESPTSLASSHSPLIDKSPHKPAKKDSKPGPPFKSEYQETQVDAVSPMDDQLPKYWYWRLMELYPFVTGRHGDDAVCSKGTRSPANRGQGRVVHRQVMKRGLKVHRSVRTRIEAHLEGAKDEYKPQIRCWIESENTTRHLTRKEWLAQDHFTWVD